MRAANGQIVDKQFPIKYHRLFTPKAIHSVYKKGKERTVNKYYSDFIKDKAKLPYHQSQLFIEDLNLATYYKLNDKQLFDPPSLLKDFLRARPSLFTQWQNFQRMPKKLWNENYICVLYGKERFRMVSPIYRENIYVGLYEQLDQDETPVDFFNLRFDLFPMAQAARFLDVTLKEGDCMYVPAYYYI